MYSVNKKNTESDTLYLYNLHIICISIWFFYMIIQKIHIWHIYIFKKYIYIYTHTYTYIYIYIHIFYTSLLTNSPSQPKSPQNVLQDIELNELQAFRADYMKFRAGQVRGVGGWPSGDRRVQGEMFKIRWDMVEMDEVWRIMQWIVFFCHDLQGFRSFGHFGRCRISSIHSMVCGSKLLTPSVPCNPTSSLERVAS